MECSKCNKTINDFGSIKKVLCSYHYKENKSFKDNKILKLDEDILKYKKEIGYYLEKINNIKYSYSSRSSLLRTLDDLYKKADDIVGKIFYLQKVQNFYKNQNPLLQGIVDKASQS